MERFDNFSLSELVLSLNSAMAVFDDCTSLSSISFRAAIAPIFDFPMSHPIAQPANNPKTI
ncbi:MAG: hypothetical protein U0L43_09165 [Muribaculaceae bacterium]|nr:hypothetical protein [Muribaculaceae bacterium]